MKIARLPILWNCLWLWLFIKNRKRFCLHKIRLLGYKIEFVDPRSFFYEFEFIFRDEIYAFHCDKPDPYIIDGGGYIGLATLYFKYKYPKSIINIFEPDQTALPMLRNNIKNNNLKNVVIHEVGLYSFDDTLSFLPNKTDGGKLDTGGYSKIPVQRLSPYINQKINFLKLNIEGAELAVCQELDRNQKMKNIKELCIEWHSFANQKQNLDELLTILKKNNFKYYISNFRGAPKGKFDAEKQKQFYLLIYAKNLNEYKD